MKIWDTYVCLLSQTDFKSASAVVGILLLLLACLNKSTFGQNSELFFKNLSVRDGLSHATAHHVMQDHHGFIWISTRDGLNRYNGQNFKVFKNEPENPNSLSSNTVWLSYEDKDGLIWIGTSGGGLNVYDPNKDLFFHFFHEPEKKHSISANTVISIFEDKSGTMWIGTDGGGLNKVIRKQWKDGELELSFEHYMPDNTSASISNSIVMDIVQQDSSYLWIATYGGGINRFNLQTEEFTEINVGGSYVMSVAIKNDNLWAGTKYNGLSLLTLKDNSLRVFRHDSSDPQSINSNFVWPVFIDDGGDVWAGTYGGGLNRIITSKIDGKQHFAIKSYQKSPSHPASLPDNYIQSVFQDSNNTIWVASENAGVSMFRKKIRFRPPDIRIADSEVAISDLKFNDFLLDEKGNVWMGTASGMLVQPSGLSEARFFSADGKSKIVNVLEQIKKGTILVGTNIGLYQIREGDVRFSEQPLYQSSGEITVDRVYDIIQDHQDNIWLSTNTGLWKLNADMEVLDRFHPDDPENPISSSNTGKLYLESDTLWIATSTAGINKLNIKTGSVEQYRRETDKTGTIGSNKVLDILRDKDGRFWVATLGGGLNKLTYRDGDVFFEKFLKEDGLPDNTVKSVAVDSTGNLWVVTQKGLARFNPDTQEIVSISVPVDGVNLNLNRIIPSEENEFILAASKGYRLFKPSNFLPQKKGAPLMLTGVKVNNKDYPINEDYPAPRKLKLSHEENFLTFEFSLLDYFASDFANYRYKMEGVDREWIQPVNESRALYSALQPGNYIFRVQAVGYDGTPAQNQLALAVSILPPYWQTWWFRLLVSVLIIFLLWMIYRYRVNTLLEVERTRRSIAGDLHDDISATLSSITYFARALRVTYPDLAGSRTLNLILDSSEDAKEKISDIVWSIDPEHDDWMDLLSRCRRYASDVFESKSIDYQLDIIEEIDTQLTVELRKELWLIFKEMVTNVARHSQADKVHIVLNYDYALKLIVEDNGIGMEEGSNSEGNGLRNIRRRASNIGADVTLESAPGKGARWELILTY